MGPVVALCRAPVVFIAALWCNMQLGRTIINTPKDDPTRFDPEWRHLVAMAWSSNPDVQWSSEYRDYRTDEAIVNQKRWLDISARATAERRDPVIPQALRAYRQALHWYKQRPINSTKYSIEAFLLTPIPSSNMDEFIGGGKTEAGVFSIYEKLFFNCREDDDSLSRSCTLRSYMACPDGVKAGATTPEDKMLKITAYQLGYTGLVKRILWDKDIPVEPTDVGYVALEAWRLVQADLLDRGIRGGMSNFDFANLLGKMVESGRLRQDTKAADPTSEQTNLVMAVLKASGTPHMKLLTNTIDQNAELTLQLAARVSSQKLATGMGQREQIVAAGEDKLKEIISSKLRK